MTHFCTQGMTEYISATMAKLLSFFGGGGGWRGQDIALYMEFSLPFPTAEVHDSSKFDKV